MTTKTQQTAVTAPVKFTENVFEHCLSYRRADGKLVQMTLTHVPGSTSFFSIATYEEKDNPQMEPESLSELALEEARYLFAFLGKLDGLNLLDAK